MLSTAIAARFARDLVAFLRKEPYPDVGPDRFNPRITTLASWAAARMGLDAAESLRKRADFILRHIAEPQAAKNPRREIEKWLGQVFCDTPEAAQYEYECHRLKLDANGRLVADGGTFASPEAQVVVTLAELLSPDNRLRVKVCKRCKKPFVSEGKTKPRKYCCKRPHRRTKK